MTNVTEPMPFRVVRGPIPGLELGTRTILWHTPAVKLLRRRRFEVVIHNFATRWASIGKIRRIQHRRGGKFILWGIGFSQTPTPLLDRIRVHMVKQADATILYSDRERYRYIQKGVREDSLFVARNSVDLKPIRSAMAQWPPERLARFKERLQLAPGPTLLSVGRLAEQKRLDLLVRALVRLRRQYCGIKLVLIGAGPAKKGLAMLCRNFGLNASVLFQGYMPNEADLAPWFLASDLVVAPGQVGLLANHAHAYGRPLVTGDDPSLHGPEVEILIPNETGLTYRYGDEESLAEVIGGLLADEGRRLRMGRQAHSRAHTEFGIPNMVDGIVRAIAHVVGKALPLHGEVRS